MSYKHGKKWRAVVTLYGKEYQAVFKTKKEAVEWEFIRRKELRRLEKGRPTAPLYFPGKTVNET